MPPRTPSRRKPPRRAPGFWPGAGRSGCHLAPALGEHGRVWQGRPSLIRTFVRIIIIIDRRDLHHKRLWNSPQGGAELARSRSQIRTISESAIEAWIELGKRE